MRTTSLLIGVDIGTTKTAALALDVERGAVTACAAAANPAPLPSSPDACEYDPRALLEGALALVARLAARLGSRRRSVQALGVTGQMHGVVLADAEGAPLTPLIGWQDQRGNRRHRDTNRTLVEEVARRMGASAQARAGCAPAAGYGAVTLFRMIAQGSLPKRAVALTIHDLLARTLAGVTVTDPTDAASWGIYDVEGASGWLLDAAAELRIPAGLLPEVRPTGSLAGAMRREMADRLHLPQGLPIAVALGDNQAAFLGSVPSLVGSLVLNLGTGGQMSVAVGRCAALRRAQGRLCERYARAPGLETRPLVAGYWLLVGASLCGGRAYQILSQFFRQVGCEMFGAAGDPDIYEAMNALASKVSEDCDGVRVEPLFSGTRADPSLRASITGLTAANFTPGHIVRATIAGMVDELLAQFRLAGAAGAHAETVVGSGNAVRRNPVLSREIERRSGLPFRMPAHDEEAALGAALAAGVAVGAYRDWHAACSAVNRATGG